VHNTYAQRDDKWNGNGMAGAADANGNAGIVVTSTHELAGSTD